MATVPASWRFDAIGTGWEIVTELPLPPAVRAVLWLADVEGRSFDEIAQILGCSVTAARTRASRGRRELRVALAAEAPVTTTEDRP